MDPMTAQMFRVLITGSRDWVDYRRIESRLKLLHEKLGDRPATLVSGACPTGADRMCETVWSRLDSPFTPTLRLLELHPANWNRWGKRAGYMRNKEMVRLGANLCLAFWRGGSNGTADTIKRAQDAGIRTIIYRSE